MKYLTTRHLDFYDCYHEKVRCNSIKMAYAIGKRRTPTEFGKILPGCAIEWSKPGFNLWFQIPYVGEKVKLYLGDPLVIPEAIFTGDSGITPHGDIMFKFKVGRKVIWVGDVYNRYSLYSEEIWQ